MDRRAALRHLLEEENADAMLVSSPSHVRWLTGFSGSSGLVLAHGGNCILVTDGRYATQARDEADVSEVRIADADLLDHVLDNGILKAGATLLVQPEHLTGSQLEKIRSRRSADGLVLKEGTFQQAMARKEQFEIDAIRRALSISEQVFSYLIDWIVPGMREFEIAAEIVYQHLRRGAQRMSFDPIVASGPNSAMPHARPTDREIEPSDILLMDFGCVWEGYASDLTRTVAIGEAPDRLRQVYDIVLEAQESAIAGARGGIRARDLVAMARRRIDAACFKDHFPHSLGH
ncbi:MAG: Xaa-Pro peptidase family protein, partial [Rhodothermales bacterium]|nr:Xaa-Pro peptidase family protein [Rhodothermales bacterium]